MAEPKANRWAEDRALAGRIADGDTAALEGVVRALHGALRRVATSWLGPGDAAEDLVQETWEAVIDHIADFEGRSALRTWITRILVNRAKTRVGRARIQVPIELLERGDGPSGERFNSLGLWMGRPAYAVGPEEVLIRQRARQWLGRALEELPEAQRAVVVLRDVEEWSAEEVCNALGLSESNQRVLLHRGRTRLRAALERALEEKRPPCG